MSDAPQRAGSRPKVFLFGLVVGLILGAGVAVALGAIVEFSPGGPVVYTDQSTDVIRASPGDCLLGSDGDHVAVTCGDTTVSEVYAKTAPPVRDTSRYPGRDALDMFGAGACELAFENYLNEPYLSSDRDYRVLVPDLGAWSAGHRDVYCLLRS